MRLILGDCFESLKELPADSVDSVVTDPPYELGFMGKSWDSTGIAFQPKLWAEVLRVLKPGGHLLSFSGSRTYHRMVVAIEDAGFEIRDQIMWIYGSGFPKSHNISKAIDKLAGAEREVVGVGTSGKSRHVLNAANTPDTFGGEYEITAAASDKAKQWEGWGTALKPAHEPIVVARKPLIGTVAENVLEHGTGGLNIDGSRVGTNDSFGGGAKGKSGFAAGYENDGWVQGSSLGRFPANVIHDGSDEVVDLFPDTGKSTPSKGHFRNGNTVGDNRTPKGAGLYGDGAWIAGSQHSDSGSAARFFYCAKASKHDRNEGLDGFEAKRPDERTEVGMGTFVEKGVAKQSNHHPTVKPTDLMRYLCRLVTPPNGIVLDPFMGSGSTGKAAVLEGFDFIGMEQSEEYITIAQARIEHAESNKGLW